VVGDFLVGPAPCCQHGDGKFCGGKVVGHIFPGVWIMYFALPGGKTVGNGDDALEILRPVWFNHRFEHSAQKAVVFSKSFN
jgi:hypothetical protein